MRYAGEPAVASAGPRPGDEASLASLEEYIQAFEDLGEELEMAMAAIARNKLDEFEESVSRQEVLCARVLAIATRLGPEREVHADLLRQEVAARLANGIVGAKADGEEPSSVLPQRMRAAREALRAVNQRYTSLLKHSGRSIELFTSLCRSYAGQTYTEMVQGLPKEVRSAGPERQAWQCDM